MVQNSINTLVRSILVIFILWGFYFMYIYHTRIQEERGISYKNISIEVHGDVEYATETREIAVFKHESVSTVNRKKMIHVLQWTPKTTAPFNFMGTGNSAFIDNECKFTNCFITDNTTFLNLTEFDAIVFNGKSVYNMQSIHFPSQRSEKQKYIFGAMESSDNYPVCIDYVDNYFNWTWTYKLDSDFRWGYITIYDTEGNVVGPAIDMNWPEIWKPISDELKAKLSGKSKAATWFVSNCNTKSKREKIVAEVNKELKRYGLKVDIYGDCGEFKCPRDHDRSCAKMVESDYFFYFSMENSLSEDYVTEKLLTALNNYAVPIVFGAANYSRFLPEGSYLDARKLSASNLARVMNEIISNRTMYHDFFRWRGHFVYKETSNNMDICKLCEVLNDDEMVNTVSVWRNFREWWNGARYKVNCR